MYTYIHVELMTRELDSKLLLSLIAANRGLKVYLGNLNQIVQKKGTPPGIFHNKDITASAYIVQMFKNINKNKISITSQDDEGGVEDRKVDRFVQLRYSKKTLKLVKKVFTWGAFDYKELTRVFKNYTSKIINTGSPRLDFYKPILKQKEIIKKNILISSNFGTVLERRSFWDFMSIQKKAYTIGNFENSSEEKKQYDYFSHNIKIIYEYIKLIRFLTSKYKNNFFILRPHPVESISGWKELLGNIPNLQIIRKGSLFESIFESKIVIQTGCYSAIESTLAGVDVINFNPFFNEKLDKYFPTKLGHKCININEVDKKIKQLLEKDNYFIAFKKKKLNEIKKRINFDEQKLSSILIVDEWLKIFKSEKIIDNKYYFIFNIKIFFKKIIYRIKNWIKFFLLIKDPQDTKFPKIDLVELIKKSKDIIEKLDLDRNIKIEIIDKNLCYIKKK
jgi:surface carbohydrate biosynthesis protein